jgi:hypothetical protein
MMKPDMGMIDVPVEIVMDALVDGGTDAFRNARVLEEMREIHAARHWNIVHKRQATHMILSERAMRRFIRTGVMSDHFFAMRPFSPAERVEILRVCLELAQGNPGHHIYFIKDEDLFKGMAFTGFGEVGLRIQDIGMLSEQG